MQQYLIFGIFMFIYQKKKTTAKQIAEVFEISTRSVYRYVIALSCAEIPIYTQNGKNGGIFIREDFKMEGIYFNENEKDVLRKILIDAKRSTDNSLIDKLLQKI